MSLRGAKRRSNFLIRSEIDPTRFVTVYFGRVIQNTVRDCVGSVAFCSVKKDANLLEKGQRLVAPRNDVLDSLLLHTGLN